VQRRDDRVERRLAGNGRSCRGQRLNPENRRTHGPRVNTRQS
jgi:hypothetical protein